MKLREERTGADSRHLWACVDDERALQIDGQDLGPGTDMVSSDGEYEWFKSIAAADVPASSPLVGDTTGEARPDACSGRLSRQRDYALDRPA